MTTAIHTIRTVTDDSSFILGLDLNVCGSAITGVKQVGLQCLSIYHTYTSQWMDKICRMPSLINRALTAKETISSSFVDDLRSFCAKLVDWPARQSPTALTFTLMVDCPWCLPWTEWHWFFYPYCWWLSALLTQFLPNIVSSMTSTLETKTYINICW